MYRGNADQVMADAAKIARRLRDHQATVTGLAKEYESSHATLMKAVLSQMSKAEYRRIVHHNITIHNSSTRFQPGHATWNKDLKGTHFSPQSEFKKGGPLRGFAARRWRPIGAITVRYDPLFPWQRARLRKDGTSRKGKPRRWIKVKDDGRLQDRWIPYARDLWEKHYGPVPNGLLVVHKDGNQMNDVIDNLILVDRRRHISRTCHSSPEVRTRAHTAAVKSRKANTPARRLLRAERTNGTRAWHCPACGATYESAKPPARCEHCSAVSFERLTIPRFG